MLPRLVLAALLGAFAAKGCVTYEYEHEFWLRVDGSGSVYVTGRPALWTAFKGLPPSADVAATRRAARALFERSGLRVRRVTVTHRFGRDYLFLAADFTDVNRLSGSPAFPDLRLALQHEAGRLRLQGEWKPPPHPADAAARDRDGLMAVRFHLPSKVYTHQNASEGVERGNILSWRQDVAAALDGGPLVLGATLDERSILGSTVALFGWAIAAAGMLFVAALYLAVRKGRRERSNGWVPR
jgi:hypothetical protein